jgi:predicted nucleic acid-binding protein
MTMLRYPVITKSLNFTSEDEVFLDSSFVLTSMVNTRDQNKNHQYAHNVLDLLKQQKAQLYISPTVFSEVIDGLMAILFGNDLIFYAKNESDKSKYTDHELAKKCFENNGIISEHDIGKLKNGVFKDISYKGYLSEFSKNPKRKNWLKKYHEPSYTIVGKYVWAHKIKTLSSIDEEYKRTVSILPAMENMNLRSHDALHYSTAVHHFCNYFLTVDEDFKNNLFEDIITIILVTNKKQ